MLERQVKMTETASTNSYKFQYFKTNLSSMFPRGFCRYAGLFIEQIRETSTKDQSAAAYICHQVG
jgi:hypothetical protein